MRWECWLAFCCSADSRSPGFGATPPVAALAGAPGTAGHLRTRGDRRLLRLCGVGTVRRRHSDCAGAPARPVEPHPGRVARIPADVVLGNRATHDQPTRPAPRLLAGLRPSAPRLGLPCHRPPGENARLAY